MELTRLTRLPVLSGHDIRSRSRKIVGSRSRESENFLKESRVGVGKFNESGVGKFKESESESGVGNFF